MKIIDHMKRVNAILRAAQDNPRLRKEVADQTSKYVRDTDPNRDRNFEELLTKLEKKLKINNAPAVTITRRKKGTPP